MTALDAGRLSYYQSLVDRVAIWEERYRRWHLKRLCGSRYVAHDIHERDKMNEKEDLMFHADRRVEGVGKV